MWLRWLPCSGLRLGLGLPLLTGTTDASLCQLGDDVIDEALRAAGFDTRIGQQRPRSRGITTLRIKTMHCDEACLELIEVLL